MFTESRICVNRIACKTCRRYQTWRIKMMAPDVCPHDVTLEAIAEKERLIAEEEARLLAATPPALPAPKVSTKKPMRIGDVAEVVFKPIAKILGKTSCYDTEGKLKPISPCGKRKKAWNEAQDKAVDAVKDVGGKIMTTLKNLAS